MHYIQSKEVIGIVLYLVAILIVATGMFIRNNKLLLWLYFSKKKSIVKLKGRGTELVETRIKMVIEKAPSDGRIYEFIEVANKVYQLDQVMVYGRREYLPVRASVMFKRGNLVAVALEDKQMYDLVLKEYVATCRNVFKYAVPVIIVWKILLLKKLVP